MCGDEQREKRLDRAFDMIILLTGILSAALFQFVTTLGDISLTIRYMKGLFLPIVFLTIFWLLKQVIENRRVQVFMRIFVWFYGTWALFQDLSFFISWGFLLLGEIHRLCIGFISGALTQLLLIYLHRKYGWAKSPDVIAAYVFSIAMMVLTLLVSGPLPSLPGI